MRTLIYVPVVHSGVDLGSVEGEVRQRFREVFGCDEWEKRFASVEAMWDGLRSKLLALPLDWKRTRLYQDGLPVCGRESEIVRDLARQGSRNHRLLSELVQRGATLMGTEKAELIVAEYWRIQKLVKAAQERAPDTVGEELKVEGERILKDRDAFIAQRVDSTLLDGETGVLFLGLLHRVDEMLEPDLEVRHVIHSLPFGADPWRRLRDRTHHDD